MAQVRNRSKESEEDYLETILILMEQLQAVRSVDIAEEMEYSKASISVAMKNLKEKEYIEISKEGYITLTPSGNKIASEIYERHKVITDLLIGLGVNPVTASEEACKIEHDISAETFEAIKRHISGKKINGV